MANLEKQFEEVKEGVGTKMPEEFRQVLEKPAEPEHPEDPERSKWQENVMAVIRERVKRNDIEGLFNFVEHLARYDAKTGLLNADAFRDRVELVFAQLLEQPRASPHRGTDTQPGVETPQDKGDNLSMVFLDLDDFKKVNDAYGHLAGDAALAHVATMLREKMRDKDIKGRFGGEELLVAMVNNSPGDRFLVAEKLRKAIAETPFAFEGKNILLSASIGVAKHKAGETYEQLLSRANVAMKHAKLNGKNRVSLAEEIDLEETMRQAQERALGQSGAH